MSPQKVNRIYVQRNNVFGMRLPSAFSMIGTKSGLEDYQALNEFFKRPQNESMTFDDLERVVTTTHARVGLMGNPSDGYFGKTLGLSVENFWATVTLEASETLRLIPNALYDPSEFGSLGSLYDIGKREGYQGGMRLLMATCKKFSEYCMENRLLAREILKCPTIRIFRVKLALLGRPQL